MLSAVEVVGCWLREMLQQKRESRGVVSKAMTKGELLYIVFELEGRKQNLLRRSQGRWRLAAFSTGRLCQVRNIQSHLEMWSRCRDEAGILLR